VKGLDNVAAKKRLVAVLPITDELAAKFVQGNDVNKVNRQATLQNPKSKK
jgi:hypothetical protein